MAAPAARSAIRFWGSPCSAITASAGTASGESGSGHGSYATFARAGVTVTGEAKHWDMVGDSGNVKTRGFCARCGLPVYLTFAAMPDIFTIRAASLDEPARYKPQVVTYAARGHQWDRLDPDLPKFEGMPPG
ncbi:hypothetical protein BRDID11002_29080 [Bradyrhizobium diazoefficiens]